LLEAEIPRSAEKFDRADAARLIWIPRVERMEQELAAAGGPAQRGGVENVAVRILRNGVADVLRRVGLDVVILFRRVGGGLRGAFAEDGEGARVVDGFAIDAEPIADLEQNDARLLRNGSIGLRAYVEQQVAVFADGVDELLDEGLCCAVLVVLGVAPGVDADGGVGLPGEKTERVELAALNVERGGVGGHRLLFVGEDWMLAALCGPIVIVGSELPKVGLKGRLTNPPVEVEEVGMVFVDELGAARKPVVEECLVGREPALQVRWIRLLCVGHAIGIGERHRHGWTVESGIGWVLYI